MVPHPPLFYFLKKALLKYAKCLGDKIISIEHAVIPDAQLHPMKGAAGATAGQLPVADGAGATAFTSPFNAAGQMSIFTGTVATAVTAAADATLSTNSDYVKVVLGLVSSHLVNVGFATDHLIVQKAGTYLCLINTVVEGSGTSHTGLKIAVNSTLQTWKTVVESPAGQRLSATFHCVLTLAVNDTVSLYVANTQGNVTVREAGVSIVRLGVL